MAVADQFGQPTRYKTAVTVMPLFFELSALVMTLAANFRFGRDGIEQLVVVAFILEISTHRRMRYVSLPIKALF